MQVYGTCRLGFSAKLTYLHRCSARAAHASGQDDDTKTFTFVYRRSRVIALCQDGKETTGTNYAFGITMHPPIVVESGKCLKNSWILPSSRLSQHLAIISSCPRDELGAPLCWYLSHKESHKPNSLILMLMGRSEPIVCKQDFFIALFRQLFAMPRFTNFEWAEEKFSTSFHALGLYF